MNRPIKLTAIVGTYRKGGVVDRAVDEILASAREAGAETTKIYLIDKHIEFCTNCRTCTQQGGVQRGHCPINDDMGGILEEIKRADALVLASPMNFGTVTAVMKRFIERLVCLAFWPWGKASPQIRNKKKNKVAVIVVASAAPSLMARLLTRIGSLLKTTAGVLDAKIIGTLYIGLAAREPEQDIGERARGKARKLGKRLIAKHR